MLDKYQVQQGLATAHEFESFEPQMSKLRKDVCCEKITFLKNCLDVTIFNYYE